MPKTYVLRTCNAEMRSYNHFQWPAAGSVVAPDWRPTRECGNGLHGLLMGQGEAGHLSGNPDAKWLVVEVEETEIVDLGGKVKFPKGAVVYCGDRIGAAAFLVAKGADPSKTIGHVVQAGYAGTATAGTRGTATAGDGGTATAGTRGTATAGDGGTATAGYAGTATAGTRGVLVIRWFDAAANRYRLAVGYVGEDGIEPGKKYKVEGAGKIVPVDQP